MSSTPSKIAIGSVTLEFKVAPLQYTIEKNFSYAVEPCIGQSHPVVSFEHGSARNLNLVLVFDEDIDNQVDLTKVDQFIQELSRIDPESRSPKEAEVTLGSQKFKGYVGLYRYSPMRFKSDMTPTSIRLEISLISTADQASS